MDWATYLLLSILILKIIFTFSSFPLLKMITIELLELNPFGKGMSSHTPVFEKYSPSTKTIRLFKIRLFNNQKL